MKMFDFSAIWNVKYPEWSHIRYSQYSATSRHQPVHINTNGHILNIIIITIITITITNNKKTIIVKKTHICAPAPFLQNSENENHVM